MALTHSRTWRRTCSWWWMKKWKSWACIVATILCNTFTRTWAVCFPPHDKHVVLLATTHVCVVSSTAWYPEQASQSSGGWQVSKSMGQNVRWESEKHVWALGNTHRWFVWSGHAFTTPLQWSSCGSILLEHITQRSDGDPLLQRQPPVVHCWPWFLV